MTTTHDWRSAHTTCRFGPFTLDPRSRVLRREGVPVLLAPRTFDLLHCLVTSGGRLLTKDELLSVVWDDVIVEEGSVAFQVSLLRKALGEHGPAWIETVPKYGYRFTQAVEHEPSPPATESRLPPGASAPVGADTRDEPGSRPSQGSLRWEISAALVVVAVALFALAGRPDPGPPTGVDVVPLTSYPGVEQHPTFSPDGSRVAFSWERDGGKAGIHVLLIGRGSPVPLTDHPGRDLSPAWSPDGRSIAFCRVSSRRTEVVVVPAEGGQERTLTLGSGWQPICDGEQVLSWFPDAEALAVVGQTIGGEAAIRRVHLDGRTPVSLTSPSPGTSGDGRPAVSPDGRALAFTRSESGHWVEASIYLMPLSASGLPSGPATVLVPDAPGDRPGLARVMGLAWGTGGQRLLFSQGGLWSVAVKGAHVPEPHPLQDHRLGVFGVATSGTRLAFAAGTSDVDIFELQGPAASRPRAAAQAPAEGVPMLASTLGDTNPQFSPDGRRIAFTSARSGSLQIWVSAADGSDPVQVTDAEGAVGSPRWSPDGHHIAYDTVGARGRGDIVVIPAGGGPGRRITPADSHEHVPSWSRDGTWVYFESNRMGRTTLWKAGFPAGPLVQVSGHGGAAAFESADGRWVYYGKRGVAGLWRRPVTGGPEAQVIARGHAMFWGMHDRGACWMDPLASDVVVECLDFDSSRVSTVARLPNDGRYRATGPGFAVSPDGTRLLYVRVSRQESDLMLADIARATRR